jgi:8-oxo-dGTP pyrophosphatase MutT (NUDIX family)
MTGEAQHHFGNELRQKILTNLGEHPRTELHRPEMRQAAVAITIVPGSHGAAGFILTRRSSNLRSHAYQYALPGGKIDPGEDAEQAARRELSEEVSLDVGSEAVLGALDDYETRSGYIITPIVVWVDGAESLEPQRDEVDQVHIIDLHQLDRSDSPRWVEIDQSPKPVIQLPIQNRLIHAPTGALLYQFREVGMHGRLVRTDSIEEPVWAWR